MDFDPLTDGPSGNSSRARDWALLIALWLGLAALVFLLARGVIFPRRFIDEFLYWNVARNLSHGQGLSWNGEPLLIRSWLYPALIAPAFKLATSVQLQYQTVQAINSMLISAVVLPTWWMARRIVGRAMAALAALFAAAVPALNYAGLIGTESLGYLTCTLAFAAILFALAVPGWRSASTALAMIFVAVLTRTQFVLLVPVLAASLFLVAAFRGTLDGRRYLVERRPVLILLAALCVLGLVYVALRGRSSVGIYIGILDGSPTRISDPLFWLRGFASDLYLLSGIVPTIATFALAGSRTNRRHEWIGPLVALAFVASTFFVLQMTWFSAINTFGWREQHIFYERYMFYLGPIFFVGLVAAFGRISTRAAVISTLAGASIVALTPSEIISVPFSIDAFGQAYLGYLFSDNDALLGSVGPLLGVLTLLLGGLLVVSTLGQAQVTLSIWGRRLAIGLPIFLLVLTQAKAWSYSQLFSESARGLQPKPLKFVEQATEGRVGMLVAEGSDPSTYYATAFWNPNVDRFFVSSSTPVNSPRVYAPVCDFGWSSDGTIGAPPQAAPNCKRLPSAWLVQSDTFAMHLRDQTLRVEAHGGIASTVAGAPAPTRILVLTGGRNVRTGAVGDVLTMRTFLDRAGELELKLKSDAKGAWLALPNGTVVRILPGQGRTLRIAVGAGERLGKLRVSGLKAGGRGVVFFERMRLREGNGPWRDVT